MPSFPPHFCPKQLCSNKVSIQINSKIKVIINFSRICLCIIYKSTCNFVKLCKCENIICLFTLHKKASYEISLSETNFLIKNVQKKTDRNLLLCMYMHVHVYVQPLLVDKLNAVVKYKNTSIHTCHDVKQEVHIRWPHGSIFTSLSFSAQILHSWNVEPISQYNSYCSWIDQKKEEGKKNRWRRWKTKSYIANSSVHQLLTCVTLMWSCGVGSHRPVRSGL